MPRVCFLIMIFAALATGCGTSGGDVDKPTITQAQALARVEQLIKETADMIKPGPRLELDRTSLELAKCHSPTDGGSEDRVIVDRGYYLRDIPKDQIGQVAKQIREYWQQQGHIIEGFSKDGTTIAAHSRPDDFLLSLDGTGDDVLLLGASSPCVWPNGTPEPSSGV